MGRIKVDKNVFVPMPVALVGTLVRGRPNFMAAGWLTRVNITPPLIAVVLNNAHHTPQGVAENGTFSLCFPSTAMVRVTDYCGIVSGHQVDKSGLFELFYGDTHTAPMIAECPLNIECRLVQTVAFQDDSIYIGEIVAAYCEERCLTDGSPDFGKIDPLLLTMPDNRYWRFGAPVGRAWQEGHQLQGETAP